MTDLADCTATQLLRAVPQQPGSPVEATQAVLARIERLNPVLQRLLPQGRDEALRAARASEARWQRGEPCGALDGVPVSIKDLILAKGWPTLRGSAPSTRTSRGMSMRRSAARLREAGAVLLGKTTTPEFGCKGETNSPLTGITPQPVGSAQDAGRVVGRHAPPRWRPAWGRSSVGTDGAGSACASRPRSAATSA